MARSSEEERLRLQGALGNGSARRIDFRKSWTMQIFPEKALREALQEILG